jgi:pyridoxamine 5'-phosphate oxidase
VEVLMQTQLADMRVDYRRDELDVGDLAPTWHEQLTRWLDEATGAGVVEPNAMVLASTDDDGVPSSRTVLCKGIDERGVVIYTNYTSAKSHDLRSTRRAAATFPWYALQRQVSLRGVVALLAPE